MAINRSAGNVSKEEITGENKKTFKLNGFSEKKNCVRGTIFSRKKGYNPNSSSVGSDVPTLLFFMFFCSSIVSLCAVFWSKITAFFSGFKRKSIKKKQEHHDK